MKTSDMKKALAPIFKNRLKAITWKVNWNSVKSNEKARKLQLTVGDLSPEEEASLTRLEADVNATIKKNMPDTDIVFEVLRFHLQVASVGIETGK